MAVNVRLKLDSSNNIGFKNDEIDKQEPILVKLLKLHQEEEEIKNDEMLLNPGLLDVTQQNEKSRRFSKLPPAPLDAPNAVQLGSKFTMIPRDLTQKQ